MSRQQDNQPTKSNSQDYLVDFTGWDFSQFGGQQAQPQEEEPGFLSKLGTSALAIGEGLTMLPGGMVDTVRDVWRGGDIDVNDDEALRERREREREQAEYARKYQGKTFEGVTDAMLSMPYSLTTMGASLGAGAVGAVGGPVAAGATGMAAAGTVAYRATKEDFLRRMLDQTKQVLGRMPSQEEWDRVAEEFDGEATKFGLWEAGPEALSNLFMAKLLGPLGKGLFRGSAGQGIKRLGGLYGEEFATESATQMGQGAIEADIGLRESAPNAWEAFKEVAPATFWQTTLMAGGKKAADVVANRMRRRAADVAGNADGEQSSESPQGGTAKHAGSGIEPWWTREETQDQYTGPRGAGSHSLEAMRGGQQRDTEARPDTSIPWWRASSQPQNGMAVSIERGETVNLLQDNAAPAPAQRQWLEQTPWESPLATPFPDASSFTMDAMLSPAVMPARPANAFLSDAEHADSENFVRKFEEQERLEGDKAMSLYGPMSRMRESYPINNGVLSQIGRQAMPLAVTTARPITATTVPTQGQITNTQSVPRADTMAQAQGLGMPAPNPLAPGIQDTSQIPAAQNMDMGPQPAMRGETVPPESSPGYNYFLPSFVTAQTVKTPLTPAPQASQDAATPVESRADLLQQLPPESRADARRLTNAQLREAGNATFEADSFGTAHTEFSGKPTEAIEHLMRVKEGHVPAAFHKKGLGDIDLPWGKGGKKGYGLAHIIERRNSSNHDGEAIARSIPQIIDEGRVEYRKGYPGRAYIIHDASEAVIGLQWMNKERTWLLTVYPYLETGKKSSEQRLDFRPSDRSRGGEQHLPSSHSEEKVPQSPDRTTDLNQTFVSEKTPSENSEGVENSISAPSVESKPSERPAAEPAKKPSVNEQRAEILAQLPEDVRKKTNGYGLSRLKAVLAEQQEEVPQAGNEEKAFVTTSEAESGVVKSAPDNKAKEEAPHAARRGTVEGNGGEIRQASLPARGSEEGTSGILPGGEVLGRPEGNPPGPQGNSESLWREGSVGTVREEREGSGSRPEKAGRRATSIKIPNREAEPATYELMEADEVQASHLPEHSFQKNPKYGLENERRYHDEPASQRKVLENAARLDPDFVLKDSVDANNGAPVVDQDGNVLGGNGRTMSVRKAYQTGGERAEAYRAALRERADELGLNPADVDAMRRPILVRRLDKAHSRAERQALVTAMNDSFTDSKNARASGKTRGDRLSDRSLRVLAEGLKKADTLRQYFDETESAAAVDQLIRDGVIQATERNAYVGADGLLNPDGKRVVEEALRGRIARNYDALARLPADVVGKLDAVIPSALIAEKIGGPWSVTEPLRDAVDLLSEFRGSGAKEPGIFLGQVNMLTGKTPREQYSPAARQLFTLALESKKADFTQRFRKYAGEAQNSFEANGLPGVALSQPKAAEKYLGIKPSARAAEAKESEHVDLNTGRSVERDSQGSTAQNGMGEESLSVDGKRDGSIGREGGRQAGENLSASRGEGLPGHATSAAGTRRDPVVGEETSGIRERPAGGEYDSRGRGDGWHGLDVRRNGEEAVGKIADRSSDERVKTADAHLREVQEALPDLYPGQQEDVVFAEKRFNLGQGVMFTNGTGTGKTGLGLGVISRLVRAGRREILIAVPADKIGSDWISLGKTLGVPVSKLVDTKDAGMGVTVTTHANMAQNDALFNRQWDLIVIDEAHKLSSSQQGHATDLLQRLRGLSLHPGGYRTRAAKTGKGVELTKEIAPLKEKKARNDEEQERFDALRAELREWEAEVQAEIEAAKRPNRADLSRSDGKKPGVLLLSATPFAYEKSIDYAEGFLFEYPEAKSPGSYNQPNGYEQFMIEHFGYRMRYNRLTRPDAEVDAGLMQRQFNSWLKKQGVLSSRNLDTPFDYDRRFILTENGIGRKIDEGLDFLFQNYSRYPNLHAYINKRFDHLAKRYLLEAIKARESIDIIRENVRQGRKVVVFHQFNKGGGFNPFDVSAIGPEHKELYAEARAFAGERPDLARLPLKNLASPVATLKEAFPEARVFSGLVSKKEREEAVKAFQTDEGGADIIIVQADAGEAGLSLHDTTGKHQRVLINLGLPTKPVTAIQQEGRIFRAGQQSNAMFRYLNTGTNWERYAFAQTIAQRASAAENLAMGEEARGLRDAFVQAFEDSGPADVGVEGEGTGGKARDRALQTVTSEFDRAKTFYFGQQKKTSRTKAREGVDYFATPEPLGQKMVEWAGIEPGTDVLEPSAGHGAIARWFPENANRTVVEPSAELSSRLMLVTDAKLRNHIFEKLDIINKYDSIVMNPPFGAGGKTAMEHLQKAFRHLRRNGRIVAIVPDGPSMQKRLDAFFDYDEKAALVPVLRREILLPGAAFERAGTKVGTKVLIVDAADRLDMEENGLAPASHIELNRAKNIGELFDRIEDMGAPDRLGREASGAKGPAVVQSEETRAETDSSFAKAETTHAQKNIPLFVAKRGRSLSDEEYRTVASIAKKHGGYWSSYDKKGAIPGWQFESVESRDSFIMEADEALQSQESMASLAPGEFLPPRRDTRLRLRPAAVQSVADALGKTARNAAPVRVVRHFEELPASIREKYAGNAATLEGVYDPRSGKVWLVADNLTDAGRVAEVWAHEQIVHHGLRGMLSDAERKTVLNQLWLNLGGMGNSTIREIADRYGLNPRADEKARQTVMEEVTAALAEKRQEGSLGVKEQSVWRKIVHAVLRAWNRLVQAVSGRSARIRYENVDALLADLGRFVMEGVPRGRAAEYAAHVSALASVGKDGEAAGRAAWEQVRKDTQAWERQLDGVRAGSVHSRQILTVGRTPGVLQKLGAPDLPMTMTQNVLAKIGEGGKHGLPDSLIRLLPTLLAEPVMVFRSGTQASSLVALLETVHEGMPVVAAVHLDVSRGSVNINEIASVYGKSNGGIGWVAGEIQAGRRVYADKTKIPAWLRGFSKDQGSRRMSGLQLPGAFVLPNDPRGIKILTEKDVVKPVAPQGIAEDDVPLASLSVRDILGMTVRGAAKSAGAPEIRHLFRKNDISLLQGIIQLPHWIAKQAPDFAKVYERQLRRMDERSAALKNSLETVPGMFGKDRLKAADMDSLRKLLWEHEGKEPKELETVEKFLTEETLVTGREIIKVNPEFYDAYKTWLDGLDGTKAAKAAMLEVRKSLDQDLVQAHNRMAAMSEMSDDAIKKFRQSIGHVPNYFPHHRYGAYFIQAKVGDEVVFRQHFDALGEKAAMAKARKIVEEQRANYPNAEWADGKNDRLPDEVLGAPIDSEAMEQIIRAATAKIGDKERAREINDLLTEGVADVLKARGWGSHGIQRKGIPGFETEDIAKVLYDYKAGLNGWLTKMEAARDFSTALSQIDARKTPSLWKYTAQYVKDMLMNSDRVDRITGNIKSVAFAWYLGGSIKTAFVNATQNLVVGVPRLQMDVTGGGREWLAGAQAALVDRVTGNKGKGLTDDEARLVRELGGEKVITDAYMEEVRGQLGNTPRNLWNRFTSVLGWPMSEVERFNRASLALAAFRAARSGKLKVRAREKYGVKGKASYEQAKAFASDVVRDAHFVYGKSNMPEFMRSNTAGRAMASMYTFRTFTHNMVAMWSWALRTQGKEGAAFVAKSLGATMALGGVTALPLYATLMALFQAVTGDDDDWTELIRSHLPKSNLLRDVVCYGAPAMAGVNIGGSIKMETPLTRGLTRGKTPQEVLTDSIGDIIGIPYDLLVVKPSRVMEAHSKGNTWRMLEEAAPVAVKNGMQAWRLYSEGQTTMSGRPINDPGEKGARRLTGGESFGKLLGFQPVSSTKSYDAYAATKHADQVRSDKIDELTVLALKTYDTGDSAGRREANRELREWNEKMRAEGKPHMLITLKDVMRRVNSRRRENRATPKAMQKRERHQAVWGS